MHTEYAGLILTVGAREALMDPQGMRGGGVLWWMENYSKTILGFWGRPIVYTLSDNERHACDRRSKMNR
jgi:hypothetical protein